jgi:hypothetical protein
VAHIGIEDGKHETAFAKGFAITRVLVKDLVEVRNAEIDGGEAVGEVAAGNANDGAGEQARGSEGMN